jgi:hypothetical protein
MKHQILSVRFVIMKSKINRPGLCPKSCRLTLNGERKVFASGLFVIPQDGNLWIQMTR